MLLTCKSCIVKQCNNSKIKCSEFGFVDKALLTEQWVTDKTKIHITKQSCLGWKGPQKSPTSNLPHHRQYHLPVPTALWKLWGVQCFSKPKKLQPPTAWQNRSTVFIKHHQLILVCSLNFPVLATLFKCTAQGGGDLSCWSQGQCCWEQHGYPCPTVYCFHPGKAIHSLGTTVSWKSAPQETWVLIFVTVSPRRGWTTSLFQYLTSITCLLSSRP